MPQEPVYTFEHNEVKVEYYRAAVKTQLEKRRIMRALLEAYGYRGVDVPNDTWDNFDEYSSLIAQCKTESPWWTSSMATPEQIAAAFECWLEEPPGLLTALHQADVVAAPPKKTV